MASLGDSLSTQAFDRINRAIDRAEQPSTRDTPVTAEESSIDSYGRNVREKFKIGEELHHWRARARFHPKNPPRRHDSRRSSQRLHGPPIIAKKSKSFSGMPARVEASPSQEAMALPQASVSFGGFSFGVGGDTQAGNTQIYSDHLTSRIMSSGKPMASSRDGNAVHNAGDASLHTMAEGDSGHIDLLKHWSESSRSQRNIQSPVQSSSEDELSQQTQFHAPKMSSITLPPETPAMAGSKRNHRGQIVSSTSTKTPGTNLTTVFGNRQDATPGMSMSQMFNATQARSSPLPEALRSDPIFQRPSPNFETYHHSSPLLPTSSPIKQIQSDLSRAVTEPRDTYTTMKESQEMREMRLRKQQEERRLWADSSTQMDDESGDESDELGMGPIRSSHVDNTKSVARKELREIPAAEHKVGGSRPQKQRRPLRDSKYATPGQSVKKSQSIVEISDDPLSDEGDEQVGSNDEYDELAQDVRKSQAQYEDDDAGEDELMVPMTEILPKERPKNVPTNESSPLSHYKAVSHKQKDLREDDLQVAGSQQSSRSTARRQEPQPSGSAQSSVVANSQPTNQDKELSQASLPIMPRVSVPTSQLMDSEVQSWSPGVKARVRKMVGISSLPLPPPSTGQQVQKDSDEAIPSSPPVVTTVQREESGEGAGQKFTPIDPLGQEVCQGLVDETVIPSNQTENEKGDPGLLSVQNRSQTSVQSTKERNTTPPASAIPETDPIELPSTPSRKINRETDNPPQGSNTSVSVIPTKFSPGDSGAPYDIVASVTPSKSTAPYDTAQSQLSSPLKTPRSSQRLESMKDSPRFRNIRKLTDIAADSTPPDAVTEVDLDGLNPMTIEDEEYLKVVKGQSSVHTARRHTAHRPNPLSQIESSPDASPTESASKVVDRQLRMLPPSNIGGNTRVTTIKLRSDAEPVAESDVRVPRQSPTNGPNKSLITPQAKVTKEINPHIRRSGRVPKATAKLRDQLQVNESKVSKSGDQDTYAGQITKAASPVQSIEDLKMAKERAESSGEQTRLSAIGSSLSRLQIPPTGEVIQDPNTAEAMDIDEQNADVSSGSADSSPLSSPPTSPVIVTMEQPPVVAPNRVLALCKCGNQAFWPAVYLGPSTSGPEMYEIRFDDGSVDSNLPARYVKALKLHIGDQVKVDVNKMRTQSYVVQGFKNKVSPSNVSNSITDVYGFQTLVLRPKNRDSINGNQSAEKTVTVPFENIYLTKSNWASLQDRSFDPAASLPSIQQLRRQTPSTATSSRLSTPSRARRQSNPTFAKKDATTNASISHSRSHSPPVSGIFNNHAFALTFKDDPSQREVIATLLRSNGAHILDTGFDELFDIVNPSTTESSATNTTHSDTTGTSTTTTPTLALKPPYHGLGFTALLTTRHSRTAKHMHALALGLPILHARWVHDSLRLARPLSYAPYLLPAGESSVLEGATRSLVLPQIHNPADAMLERMLAAARTGSDGSGGEGSGGGGAMLGGKAVLLIAEAAAAPRGKSRGGGGSALGTFEFLVRAMGAARVGVARTVREKEEELKDAGWDVVFVEGADGEMARKVVGVGKGRSDLRAVGDEFVVQSLILGKLVEES
ncbi:MAG: hypothetical protein M1822_007376 [Bathelium mastoideum]|nr:MAG: hypothetical protein M1822_007376 [Bathelium mastoideum]